MTEKTLNEDVRLIPNEYGEWDIDFQNDDWVNVSGVDSVLNACIIAIMTRFKELGFLETYENFGCKVHELIKENKGKDTKYHIELYIAEVLEKIRRIKTVNWVEVTDSPDDEYYNYKVTFNITCISDDDEDGEIIEESFKI